jgi:hypothetical protein
MKFVLNSQTREVSEEVAGRLLSASILAAKDLGRGVAKADSLGYNEMCRLLSRYVYEPAAKSDDTATIEIRISKDQAEKIKAAASQVALAHGKSRTIAAAYRAMRQNGMATAHAMGRLAERFNCSVTDIRQHLKVTNYAE